MTTFTLLNKGSLLLSALTRELVTPATLPELFAAAGVTVAQAAAAAGVEAVLLERVIAGRQPLAADLVQRLAVFLGVGQGDVAGCAGYVSTATGPDAHVAFPPETARGDAFPTFPLAETQAVPLPTGAPPSLIIWVCGALMGVTTQDYGLASGVVRIERNSGLIISRTDLPLTNTPVEMASAGKTVFTAGGVTNGVSYGVARLLPSSGALIGEATPSDVNKARGVVFEPSSSTCWICDEGLPEIVEIDVDTGQVISIVQLVKDAQGYGARDVIAVHGLLYVTGTHSGSPNLGRVFEVDPVAKNVLRVSAGLSLGDAWGIAFDGNATFWVTSRGSAGNTAKVSAVDLATLTASTVSLGGDFLTMGDPSWIEFVFGGWWITDTATTGGSRLMAVDLAAKVQQSRSFGGSAGGGHCASDGWFLWYADKANGYVHLLDPANIAASQVQVFTRGAPDGLLIL